MHSNYLYVSIKPKPRKTLWQRLRWFFSWTRISRDIAVLPYRGQPLYWRRGKLRVKPRTLETRWRSGSK